MSVYNLARHFTNLGLVITAIWMLQQVGYWNKFAAVFLMLGTILFQIVKSAKNLKEESES